MRKTWGTWAGAAVVVLSVAACGSSESTTGAGGAGGGTGGNGGSGGQQGPACEGQPDTLDLVGTWAALGVLSVKIEGQAGSLVSICPVDQIGEANLLLFITIGQDSADPKVLKEVRATLCAVDLPAVTAVAGTCDPGTEAAVTTEITVPDALLAALPNLTTDAVGGALDGVAPGAGITLEKFVVTAGSNKNGDALPSWDTKAAGCDAFDIGHSACEPACVADCAGLVDDDGDGYPGVTLNVCGRTQDDAGKPCNADDPINPGVTIQGRAFAALEVDPQFTGVATSSCELKGSVNNSVHYTVVGADVTLTGSPISVASAIEALPTLVVQPAQSKLTMRRVDGKYGTADLGLSIGSSNACTTLLAKKNEIF